MFEIVTDNTADLFEGYYDENPTRRLPFSFTLEDRFYEKDDEYPIELFYEKLKAGKLVKTSQINPHDAEVMFEQVLQEGKDLLYIVGHERKFRQYILHRKRLAYQISRQKNYRHRYACGRRRRRLARLLCKENARRGQEYGRNRRMG